MKPCPPTPALPTLPLRPHPPAQAAPAGCSGALPACAAAPLSCARTASALCPSWTEPTMPPIPAATSGGGRCLGTYLLVLNHAFGGHRRAAAAPPLAPNSCDCWLRAVAGCCRLAVLTGCCPQQPQLPPSCCVLTVRPASNSVHTHPARLAPQAERGRAQRRARCAACAAGGRRSHHQLHRARWHDQPAADGPVWLCAHGRQPS